VLRHSWSGILMLILRAGVSTRVKSFHLTGV